MRRGDQPARSRCGSGPGGRPPQDALVADPAGEAVGVEALEQELRGAARDAEQVAEAGERDLARALALLDQRLAWPRA